MLWACTKVLLVSILMLYSSCFALPLREQYNAGKHYDLIDEKILQSAPVRSLQQSNGITYVEFFNYGCLACQFLRMYFDTWYQQMPSHVKIHRCSVGGRGPGRALSQLYYALVTLNKAEDLDQRVFTALHQKRINLLQERQLAGFIQEQGLPKDKFFQVYHSRANQEKIDKAQDLIKALKISATPTIVIIGPKQAYVTDMQRAEGPDGLLHLLDHLIALEAQNI